MKRTSCRSAGGWTSSFTGLSAGFGAADAGEILPISPSWMSAAVVGSEKRLPSAHVISPRLPLLTMSREPPSGGEASATARSHLVIVSKLLSKLLGAGFCAFETQVSAPFSEEICVSQSAPCSRGADLFALEDAVFCVSDCKRLVKCYVDLIR